LESPLAFPSQLPHPVGRTLFELGVILILPGTSGSFKRLDRRRRMSSFSAASVRKLLRWRAPTGVSMALTKRFSFDD
jgi:hypothetical protein